MEQHWSKDYIEHLRATHFALILLCTAGIIIALAPGKPEISPARQQLDQIRTLVANWDPKFLQSQLQDSDVSLPEGTYSWSAGDLKTSITLATQEPVVFVTLDKPRNSGWQNDCRDESSSRHPRKLAAVIPAPQTLTDFEVVWDSLSDGATLYQPSFLRTPASDIFALRRGQDKSKIREANVVLEPDNKHSLLVKLYIQCLVPTSVQAIQKVVSSGNTPYQLDTIYQLHGLAAGWELYLPIDVVPSAVDGQALLFRGKDQTWHYGYFEQSFRELSEALKHEDLKTLTWKHAVKVLTDQENRAPSESFEAFGMKLPATASAYGALIMILGVQWYLWAQLYEFRRKLKAGEEAADAAWVSIYISLPARSLAITSMFLLPVFAAAALGFRGAHSHVLELFSWPVSALGLCLSIGLAVATGLATPRIVAAKESAKAASTAP